MIPRTLESPTLAATLEAELNTALAATDFTTDPTFGANPPTVYSMSSVSTPSMAPEGCEHVTTSGPYGLPDDDPATGSSRVRVAYRSNDADEVRTVFQHLTCR